MAKTALGAPLKESELPANDGVLTFVTDWNKYKNNLMQGYVDVGPRPDCMGLGTMPRFEQVKHFAGVIRAAGSIPVFVTMPAKELWQCYRLTHMLYGNPHFFISRTGANLRRVRYTDSKYENRIVISEYFTTYLVEAIFQYIRYIAQGDTNTYMQKIDTSKDTEEMQRIIRALNIDPTTLNSSLEITDRTPDGFKTPAFNRLVLRVHEEIFRLDIKNLGQLTRALWPLVDEFMSETLRSGLAPCNTASRHVDRVNACRVFVSVVSRMWGAFSDRFQWRMLYGAVYTAINMQTDYTAEDEYIIQPNRKTCQLHLEFPPGTTIFYPWDAGVSAPEIAAMSRLAKTKGVFIFDAIDRDGFPASWIRSQMYDVYEKLFNFGSFARNNAPRFTQRYKYTTDFNYWMDWVRKQNFPTPNSCTKKS